MTSLEELELSRSHIESLDFLHHPDMATIKTLSLSNNQIAMITEEDFRLATFMQLVDLLHIRPEAYRLEPIPDLGYGQKFVL